MSATATRAPARAKANAVARPMPLEAPVTNATLFSKDESMTGFMVVVHLNRSGRGMSIRHQTQRFSRDPAEAVAIMRENAYLRACRGTDLASHRRPAEPPDQN